MLIRGTEYQDFLRCRLRWHYAWQRRLVPKRQDTKLFVGTLVHKWLEWYYREDKDRADQEMEALFQQTGNLEENAAEYELAKRIVEHYRETYQEDKSRYKTIETELMFRVPLNGELTYVGTIDWVGVDQDGNLIFMDHKVTKSLEKYEKNAIMDRQISRYWWVLNWLAKGVGEVYYGSEWIPVDHTWWYYYICEKPVHRFIYNIILRDAPHPPRQLKNGSLSKDRAQHTTYKLYLQEIERLGLNPDDYQDILTHLRDNPKPYFKRVEVTRNQAELVAAVRELIETAKDMINPRIYRNITPDCYWDCPYQEVCIAGMDGSNVDFLVEQLYDVKEDDPYARI